MTTETIKTSAVSTSLPGWAISVALFIVGVGSMYWFRLVLYPHDIIGLSYGLPLMLCLWHRDRRLLWTMVAALFIMAAYKNLFLLSLPGDTAPHRLVQFAMHAATLIVIGGAIHAIIDLTERLGRRNAELVTSNQKLLEREVEITRQNEELQAQTEELAQQNEEIQQQSEEIQQQSEEVHNQAEELQSQAEQLRAAHGILLRREEVLQTLLSSIHGAEHEELPPRICSSVIQLFDGLAAGAAVLERDGDNLVVLAETGGVRKKGDRFPCENNFATIIIENERTAYIEDMDTRPDLVAPVTPEGRVRSVLATPLRVDGKIAGAVAAYSRNVRSWSEAEFQIIEWAAAQCGLLLTARRLQRRLAETNVDLDQAVRTRTAELEELVTELEHFSYTIAHDLRAPLRALQGYSDLLTQAAGSLDDEQRDFLERIASAAARMDLLITDALAYSRSVRGEMVLQPLEPGPVLRGIIDSYPMLQPSEAHISIDGTLPRVLANEAGLTQCFSNLLGNAVKFVEPGKVPRIRVWAESNGGEFARFFVEDNGVGISGEVHDRIFGMFFRVSRNFDGTGIGLALVRKVAKRMGGEVGVHSEVGKGSRFWLDLRLAK